MGASLGDLMVRIGADISGFSTAMKNVIGQMDDVADKVEESMAPIEDMGKRMAVAGAEMTAAITLPLEELGRQALETAAEFEQTEVAFSTFMGSAAAAKEMLAGLYQFAATTPFQVAGVLSGARTLMAMQFAAKDILPVLRTLGDAASGLGLGQEGLDRLVFHLGQIKSEGTIDGKVLRELGMMGINAGQMLANALGKSVPDIREMISKKAIDATTAINALLEGMNDQFGGMMTNQMATLGGMWSNFKDNITLTLVQIGNALLPVAKMVLDFAQQATAGVKELAQWFMQLPAPVQAAVGVLAALAAAAGPVLGALGGIGLLLPGIMAVLAPLAAAIGVSVGALLGWAAAIGVAVAALAALGVWVAQHWDGVKAAVAAAWEGIEEIWNSTIGEPVHEVIELFEWALSKTKPIWEAIGSTLKTVWDFIKNEALSFWNFLKNDILDPMFAALEKIPGVQKLLSTGQAFTEADNASHARADQKKAVDDAMHTLRLSGEQGAIQLSDPKAAWLENHRKKVEEYTQAVNVLKDACAKGAVSADTLAKAQQRLNTAIHEKMPDYGTEGKHKVDRNALDKLSGEHAHEEAGFALRKAQIEHDYQMSQPGSAENVGQDSVEYLAQQQLAAAQKRKDALNALAKEELDVTLANLNKKLQLYRSDQAGHEKLVEQKLAAEDKYKAAVQKNGVDLETVKKQINDRLTAEDLRVFNQDLKLQEESLAQATKIADLKIATFEKMTQAAERHEQTVASMRDKALQAQMDMGELTKAQYLRLKQQQYDEAYEIELAAIQKERDLIKQQYADLIAQAEAIGDVDKVAELTQKRDKLNAGLDDRQQQATDRHSGQTQDVQIGEAKEEDRKLSKITNPIASNLGSGLSALIQGTKTLGQAWSDMTRGILSSWINAWSQMIATQVAQQAKMLLQWIAHKTGILAIHTATNEAKVASDASASAQSAMISQKEAMKEISHAAHKAAAKAFDAVVGIPVIGPVLAPIAAAAAWTGVMAFGAISAEHGAVLPNENTVAFLHPKEMVLPRGLSEGLQSMIANGGNMMANPNALTQVQGGSMSSTALQAMRGGAAAGETHNYGGFTIHVSNSAKDPLDGKKLLDMVHGEIRRRNLKMA